MRRLLLLNTWLLMAALILLCGPGPVRAAEDETKVALVIGNSRYTSSPSVPALDTPANDAKDLAEALSKIGFKVALKADLREDDVQATLEDFEREVSDSDLALFYFAGHGVQYKGENYFLPVDIAPKDNVSIKHHSVAMSSVVETTSQARKVKIIIIDACRNSVPDRVAAHSRSVLGIGDASGLAAVNATDGMIVFYSTEHGKVALDSGGSGRNSPFAHSLISRILERGRNIKDVFTEVGNDVKIATADKPSPQHPEIVSDELTSDVFLNPAETAHEAWLRIHKSKNPEDFRKFMRDFSDSPEADDAARILDDLDRQNRDAEREAEDKRKKVEEDEAKQKQAELEKRLAELKAAEQARLEKEKAEKDAAAKAEAEKQAQMAAEKKAAEERVVEEKRQAAEAAAAAAAEQARIAKEKADKEAEAKRLAEEAARAKKILADEADAARKIADREAVEKAARAAEEEAKGVEAAKQQAEAEEEARRKAAAEAIAREAAERAMRAAQEEAEAARKLEAARQQAKAEEQAREKEAAAEAAAAIADACARDQAEIVRLKDAGQSGAIQVLKSQSVCPAVPAAADQAIKDIAANHAKLCADDQKKLSTIPKDENALKAALDTLTCDSVRESASTQIAKLEAENLRAEQICADERAKFTAIDQSVPDARAALAGLQAKSQCSSLRPDLTSAISDVDKRVASAQEELQRLGCYRLKPMSGRFDPPTVRALTDYLTARHASDVNTPKITAGLVDELKGQDFQVCSAPVAPTPSSPVVSQPPPKRVLARPEILIKPKYEKSKEVETAGPRNAAQRGAAPESRAGAKPAAAPSAPNAPSLPIGTSF